MIRMNSHDFNVNQFVYNSSVVKLYKQKRPNFNIRTKLMHMLYIHREGYVNLSDLIDCVYDGPPEHWPDYQSTIIKMTMLEIRKLLPNGLKILNTYTLGYMLTEK